MPPGVQHSDDKGVKETLLDDDECPLQIFRDWPGDKGEPRIFTLKKYQLGQVLNVQTCNLCSWMCNLDFLAK